MILLAEQTVDWWARGLGAAALLVAVVSLGWTVYHGLMRDRGRLSIENAVSIMHRVGQTLSCVSVQVANKGRRPISLAWCSFDIGHKQRLSYTPGLSLKDPILGPTVDDSHKMPRRLEEGESHTFYFPIDVLRDAALENPAMSLKAAIVKDGTGRQWRQRVPKSVARIVRPDSEATGAPEASMQPVEAVVAQNHEAD